MRKLILALVGALLAVSPAVAQDRVLPAPRVDNSGNLKFQNGPTLGTWSGGTWKPAGEGSALAIKPPTGTVTRSLAERATDVIYAVDYGVTCNGPQGTDQTSAIMAATNAAVALGGRDVVFPPGVCRINTAISGPSKTRWVSRSGTVFYFHPTMTSSFNIGGQNRGLVFDGVNDILIDGITFRGAGSSTLTCAATCPNIYSTVFRFANNVVIRNSVFEDFGFDTTMGTTYPGLLVFAGSNYLIDNVTIQRTSGDNLAFSNGTRDVVVRNSRFSLSTADSALVCSIGGINHTYHNNFVSGTEGNIAPVIVMDRCSNWTVNNNVIYGANLGQAIRVARYVNTPETNRDFTISGNVIQRSHTAISVESSATTQGSYTEAGGGRFAVTGNTIINPVAIGIAIVDSEVGTITGNTISRPPDTGILVTGYAAGVNTGSLTVSGNTIAGAGGAYGIRQLAAGGTLTPISVGTNFVSGMTTPYALANGNSPQTIPYGTPASSSATCPQSQIYGMDASYLYLCAGTNALKRVPLSSF